MSGPDRAALRALLAAQDAREAHPQDVAEAAAEALGPLLDECDRLEARAVAAEAEGLRLQGEVRALSRTTRERRREPIGTNAHGIDCGCFACRGGYDGP